SRAHFSVALIEGRQPAPFDPAAPFALRQSAIAPAGRRLLANLGLWQHISHHRSCPFTGMKVWEAGGRSELFLEHTAIGLPELGHIVENALVVDSAWRNLDRVDVFCPARLASLETASDAS